MPEPKLVGEIIAEMLTRKSTHPLHALPPMHPPDQTPYTVHSKAGISPEEIDLDIFGELPEFNPDPVAPQCKDNSARPETEPRQNDRNSRRSPGKPGDPWPEPKSPRLGPKPGEPGYDPPVFQRQRERARQEGKARMLLFIQCIAKGMSIRETAETIGVHPQYARQVMWSKLKALALSDWTSPEEKERIASMIVDFLLTVLTTAKEKIGESAAYGAVVVATVKELRESLGIDLTGKSNGEGKTDDLDALAEQIREAMPALLGHHEHIARIKQRQLESKALDAINAD
jgi:hypothetical protein